MRAILKRASNAVKHDVLAWIVKELLGNPEGGLAACLTLLHVSKEVRSRTANVMIASFQKTKLRSKKLITNGDSWIADMSAGDHIKFSSRF